MAKYSSVYTTIAVLLVTCGQHSGAAAGGLKSIGVAVKECRLVAGVEKTVFEHTLSAGATHGVMTQAWHAGKSSGVNPMLRIRYYIDGETEASIDYPLFLAHGTGPLQTSGTNVSPDDPPPGTNESHTGPWASALFGRTHDSGWYNNYLVPFGKSVKITLTDDRGSAFWYMCRGVENLPMVAAGISMPPSTRLKLTRTTKTVMVGEVINFANVSNKSGLMRQFNLVINSSNYGYQEGCMSARIDGDTDLWLSSGLEDYFLGAYFHSMPTQHLPLSGFQNVQPAVQQPPAPPGMKLIPTNALAAYRIHEPDPLLFTSSFTFQWVASSDNAHHNGGYCNYDWPAAPIPTTRPPIDASHTVTVDALSWVYAWDE
eukprot:m.62236 g.62236  ORF g.62236 m.62236 type:complete len:371 (-) comp23117_c0_seq1:77-1189(-)